MFVPMHLLKKMVYQKYTNLETGEVIIDTANGKCKMIDDGKYVTTINLENGKEEKLESIIFWKNIQDGIKVQKKIKY